MYVQLYTYYMTFEWDEAKNQANIKKHSLSFETARKISRYERRYYEDH